MPSNIMQLLNNAQKHFETGNLAACEQLLAEVRKTTPDNAQMLNMQGCIELNKKHFGQAERLILSAIQKENNNATYYYCLGLVYGETQLFDRAINCYEKAIELKPSFALAHTNLSIALRVMGQYDLAVKHAKKAETIAPKDPRVNNNLAVAYESFGDFAGALKYYEKAHALWPESPEILKNLATMYVVHDQKDKAASYYKKILTKWPQNGDIYRMIAGLKKYKNMDDPDIEIIRKLLDKTDLSEIDRTHLLFALGKIYDDIGEYDLAFEMLNEANDIVDKHMKFKADSLAAYVDSHISTFNDEFFRSRSDYGQKDVTPIFVIGMPRSGTSLVETILASHSQIYGAGELDWFDQMVRALPDLVKDKTDYPACVTQLEQETVRKLGDKYVAYLQMLSPGNSYVINKLPANFQRLGLIRLLFPGAKVIHIRRNPLDTCMSIYSRLFPNNLPWSYNLNKLGEYYRQYERFMLHWHDVLPDGYICDIDYEELVARQEETTKKLINFIGLDWEEQCLDYYKNTRGVRTASSQQVKQPIYKSSVDRWRNYEKHLAPLQRAISKT